MSPFKIRKGGALRRGTGARSRTPPMGGGEPPPRRGVRSAGKKRKPAALVRLRIAKGSDGVVGEVEADAKFVRVTAEWMYALRNRSRWALTSTSALLCTRDEDLRRVIQARAKADLEKLGIKERALRQINASEDRQVEIEFLEGTGTGDEDEELLDAISAFPWEFLLSSATREMGRSHPLLITRALQRSHEGGSTSNACLFVQNDPGRIGECYSFDSERMRLDAAIGPHRTWTVARSEKIGHLGERVAQLKPRVIHVTGIDTHQVVQLLDDDKFYVKEVDGKDKTYPPPDGVIMRGDDVAESPVPYTDLASHLIRPNAQTGAPSLVTLNLYYSAARTARECVRRGAGAAIGFLDEVDDEIAEYFFQAFYWAWRSGKPNDIPRAFGRTWSLLQQQGRSLYGTGIVLWLAQSAFDGKSRALRSLREGPEEPLLTRLPNATERARTRKKPIDEVLQVDVDVDPEINYSLLHNSRRFLKSLTLSKLVDHPLDEVSVVVQLNDGAESPPFRHTELLLNEPQRTLADEVRIPLTAELLRSPRERVQSTLYVRVTWDGRVACEKTKSVTLLPVDEWFDDTENNPWLPSFVLPRDPAIARIISSARRHLITLQDDPTASFDGYQSTDVKSDDCDSVDQQVQALWTALVQEYRLAYVNPPPAYSNRNQRLRTPTEIVKSGSGTCIDLSLLLASCLEYVDIFPVVVLLTDHAFAGYWRAEEYHDEFCEIANVPKTERITVGEKSAMSTISLVDPYGWRLARQQYEEVLSYLRSDKLRFMEATGLCFNYSYAASLKEGRADIRGGKEFDSLLDINLARRASPPVTPLPMILTGREV